ncbi:YrdB family protein [Enterococcus sp. LJL99]
MISGIVLAVRFLLEIVTVLGIFSGVFIKKSIVQKLLFLLVGMVVTILWARFGAPKSPNVLTGNNKLVLEIFVYSVGVISFYSLFGKKIGTVYLIIAILDLLLMYVLKLQGN